MLILVDWVLKLGCPGIACLYMTSDDIAAALLGPLLCYLYPCKVWLGVCLYLEEMNNFGEVNFY
jgi:hypothetical protein